MTPADQGPMPPVDYKPQFTRGWWEVKTAHDSAEGRDVPYVAVGVHVVANVYDTGACKEERQANANLIAAAPKMYAALETAERTLSSLLQLSIPHRNEVEATLIRIRGARMRAEGRHA